MNPSEIDARAATYCNTLHHTSTHCNTLQSTSRQENLRAAIHTLATLVVRVYALWSFCWIHTLQHTATYCNTLQHTATREYSQTAIHMTVRVAALGSRCCWKEPCKTVRQGRRHAGLEHTATHSVLHCGSTYICMQHTVWLRHCGSWIQPSWLNSSFLSFLRRCFMMEWFRTKTFSENSECRIRQPFAAVQDSLLDLKWLSWVFATQERKEEREDLAVGSLGPGVYSGTHQFVRSIRSWWYKSNKRRDTGSKIYHREEMGAAWLLSVSQKTTFLTHLNTMQHSETHYKE